jgi:arylsulfate sulfotransferase
VSTVLLAGCGVLDFQAPGFTRTPTIRLNPNRTTPLVAVVDLATDEPTEVVLHVQSGGQDRDIEFSDMDTSHSLTVLGLGPEAEHTVHVTVSDGNGNETRWPDPLVVVTEPLPDDFPPIQLTTGDASMMEPGVTVFSVNRTGSDEVYSLLMAVDEVGDVVWFYRTDHSIADVRRIRNGHLLYESGVGADADFIEIDMAGNVVQKWHGSTRVDPDSASIPIDVARPHHEIFEMPTGNLLTLGAELRSVRSYPSSESDPDASLVTANVVDEVVAEFTREGAVVHRWSLLDILDPFRLGYGSLSEGRNSLFPDETVTRDWAHANAVIYDPSDDGYIVSLRHQDALVKIGRETGELIWILGNLEGWRGDWSGSLLLPDPFNMPWPYHTHAPALTPSGNLLVFDNGNFRVRPFRSKTPVGQSYSRVVEYAVDQEAKKVSEAWVYGGPGDESFYSPLVGDADWMTETGNILVTDGGRVTDSDGRPTNDLQTGLRWARIVEVTHATPPVKVFELIIRDESSPETGWIVYRAERLTGLYP